MLYVYKLPIFSMVGLAIDDTREMLLSSSGENSGSAEHMYYSNTVCLIGHYVSKYRVLKGVESLSFGRSMRTGFKGDFCRT